jgi:hypothetical protein
VRPDRTSPRPLGFALALVALCAPAARASEPQRSEPEARAAQPDTRATIVVVASSGDDQELRALLRELLGRQSISSELLRAERFDPDSLFETAADSRLLVFIVVGDKRARLYFRGPHGERFLLRKLSLPSGLDEVGNELIGQVVESSAMALLHSSAGLSREEASAELARETDEPTRTETRQKRAPVRRAPAPRPSPFEIGGALAYTGLWTGPELGLSHGPGLELYAGYRGALLLRLRAGGQRSFEQSLSATPVAARIQTSSLRGALELGVTLNGRHGLSLGLGTGAELVFVEPERAAESDVRLESAGSYVVPLLRPELRYELALSSVRLCAAAVTDVLLADTHYDLLENGRQRRLATPWRVRPGALLGLGFAL